MIFNLTIFPFNFITSMLIFVVYMLKEMHNASYQQPLLISAAICKVQDNKESEYKSESENL